MTEYEVVWEIKNQCPNNQMRDIFIDEIACDDPADYVRRKLKGRDISLTAEPGTGGAVTIHAVADGIIQKFIFTPI